MSEKVNVITNIVSSMISIAYYQRVHIYVKTCIQNLICQNCHQYLIFEMIIKEVFQTRTKGESDQIE